MGRVIPMKKAETDMNRLRIKVIGIGECGNSAVERMIHERVENARFISIDTDINVLRRSNADVKIQIGKNLIRGMGSANPELGRKAAEETREEIKRHIENSDMVLIVAGMGGGAGTGAATAAAEIAKSLNILTIAVVTKAFGFEGERRKEFSEDGIRRLGEKVDTLIVVKDDSIIKYLPQNATLGDAYLYIDDVLRKCVQGIVGGSTCSCFDDFRCFMHNSGAEAKLYIGSGQGDNAYEDAVKDAFGHSFDTGIADARKGFLYITGGKPAAENMFGSDECLQSEIDDIYVCTSINEELDDKVYVTIITV